MITFFQLRSHHEALSEELERKGSALLPGNPESQKLLERIDELVEEIKEFAANADSYKTFRWAHRIAEQWRYTCSAVFNAPRRIELPAPRQALVAPPSPRFGEDEIDFILKRSMRFLDWGKRAHGLSGDSESWHIAEVLFALDVLSGKINFSKRIAPRSYHHLESQWLSEVKRISAYFIWVDSGNGFVSEKVTEQHYQAACNNLRRYLVEPGIKAACSEFEDAKDYLESYVLDDDGHIHAQPNGKAEDLVRSKTHRIWQRTRRDDEKRNWHEALMFTRLFYENIIGAVVDRSEEKTRMVLKAFQFSREDSHTGLYVINCFEAALAIYFLDAGIVEKLWRESEELAATEGLDQYEVSIANWPAEFKVPPELSDRFEVTADKIRFRGVMTEKEKELLFSLLDDEDDRQMVEELFVKSRTIHRKTTL